MVQINKLADIEREREEERRVGYVEWNDSLMMRHYRDCL